MPGTLRQRLPEVPASAEVTEHEVVERLMCTGESTDAVCKERKAEHEKDGEQSDSRGIAGLLGEAKVMQLSRCSRQRLVAEADPNMPQLI